MRGSVAFVFGASILLVSLGGACRQVPGVARVLNGVTPTDSQRSASPWLLPLDDGDWRVSPDQVEVAFQEIRFVGENGREHRIDLIGCTATYDRSAPTLSERLDCDFKVPPGSYTRLGIDFEPPLRVLIDDPLNELYTDGVGLSRTPPPGGAAFSPMDVMEGGGRIQLSEPLVIGDEPVEIKVVMTALHSVNVHVEGPNATFTGGFGVQLNITPDPIGAASFYTSASTGETIKGHATELFLFYEDAATPSFAFLFPSDAVQGCTEDGATMQAFNTSPGELDRSGQTQGGYLGLDETGTICFALPKDATYTEYQAIYRMPEVTELGGSTMLSCEVTSTVPAPTSGANWSSGCPAINPTAGGVVRLVAN